MKKIAGTFLIIILCIILLFAALVLSLRFGRNADRTAQLARLEALRTEPPATMAVYDTRFDDSLKLNQLRWLATHNSYHSQAGHLQLLLLDCFQPGEAGKLSYSHLDLYTQLELGVRSLEFDLRYYRNGAVENIHVPLVDNRGHSPSFKTALEELKLWSERHPQHIPVIVIMETKDDWRFLDPTIKKWSPKALAAVDGMITEVLGGKLVTPTGVQGASASVRDAVRAGAWPELGESRGKFIFVFHESSADYFNDEYFSGEQRVSFYMADPDSPEASFMLRNEPDAEDIGELIGQGFIVRTRADAELLFSEGRRISAIKSGAQIVSTDFPAGYSSNPDGYSLHRDALRGGTSY